MPGADSRRTVVAAILAFVATVFALVAAVFDAVAQAALGVHASPLGMGAGAGLVHTGSHLGVAPVLGGVARGDLGVAAGFAAVLRRAMRLGAGADGGVLTGVPPRAGGVHPGPGRVLERLRAMVLASTRTRVGTGALRLGTGMVGLGAGVLRLRAGVLAGLLRLGMGMGPGVLCLRTGMIRLRAGVGGLGTGVLGVLAGLGGCAFLGGGGRRHLRGQGSGRGGQRQGNHPVGLHRAGSPIRRDIGERASAPVAQLPESQYSRRWGDVWMCGIS
jgi:hypothetical protein